MKTYDYIQIIFILLLTSFTLGLNAQMVDCFPDVEPPSTVACNDLVYVSAAPGGTTITADMIVEGTTLDNCTAPEDITYRLTLNPDGNLPPDETLFFAPGETGIYTVSVYPVDEAGNWGSICWGQIQLFDNTADCTDDTENPVPYCKQDVLVELMPVDTNNDGQIDDGFVEVFGSDFNQNSYDNCTASDNLLFYLAQGVPTDLPATTVLTFTADHVGENEVSMWVVDEAGNYDYCVASIIIEAGDWACIDETTPPVAICDQNTTVNLSVTGEATLAAEIFDDGSYDNCSSTLNYYVSLVNTTELPTTTSVTFTEEGDYIAYMWVEDIAGNTNVCAIEVTVQDLFGDCDDDTTSPIPYCIGGMTTELTSASEFTLWASDVDAGSYDNCTPNSDLYFTIALGVPNTPPTTENIVFPAGSAGIFEVSFWVFDEAGNYDYCVSFVEITIQQLIAGNVFLDANENCLADAGETPLENWQIQLTSLPSGNQSSFWTNANGDYGLVAENNGTDTEVVVSIVAPFGLGISCPTSYTLPLPLADDVINIDFPVQLAADCQNMTVDVSTPLLRRCFLNPYFATYCNYSTQSIDNVEVTILLHPQMTMMGSPFPYTDLGNNTFLFELGTVASGECGIIPMNIYLSCNAQLGETKCVEAEITPNDCNGFLNYAGASLQVTGECDEITEKVRFTIENVGDEAMDTPLEYIVVEDVIMYMMTPISLPSGGSEEVELDANGATWRVEVPQVDGHPGMSMPSSTVEGCGGLNTAGIVNVFSMDDADPFVSIDCQEVIGSYDPNDKKAFPTGYGEQHYIRQNEDIEYLIRFQNTGTDTAFTVRIDDQLSAHLDMYSVRPGASSHPYQMTMTEDGLLSFLFEDILLPDSFVNEPASHGFVKFKVSQNIDNPLETVIENTAGIYFDFNEAVITNTVFHTVGENFVEIINSIEHIAAGLSLEVSPNPFKEVANITLQGTDNQEHTIILYNINGQIVRQMKTSNNQFEIHRNDLSNGLYFYQIQNPTQLIASGKLIIN